MIPKLPLLLATLLVLTVMHAAETPTDDSQLHVTLRSRAKPSPGVNSLAPTEVKADWNVRKTALIICDMWDDHWCKSAAQRVTELAGPMNEMLKQARAKGIFIIHRNGPVP
jgi:hypothetical protein